VGDDDDSDERKCVRYLLLGAFLTLSTVATSPRIMAAGDDDDIDDDDNDDGGDDPYY
jgi:hypothetical protein